MMKALSSSETTVLTRATWHKIPEDGILQNCFYYEVEVFTAKNEIPGNLL
jgi:hypothetical protein